MSTTEQLQLAASVSPHVRHPDTIKSIMWKVVLALLPALLGAVYFFGGVQMANSTRLRGLEPIFSPEGRLWGGKRT